MDTAGSNRQGGANCLIYGTIQHFKLRKAQTLFGRMRRAGRGPGKGGDWKKERSPEVTPTARPTFLLARLQQPNFITREATFPSNAWLKTVATSSFMPSWTRFASSMETYNGHVRTPADAIVLFEACRLGLLPRVQRRLSEKERQSIKSGSVFVWDEREAGMRRWTDGKSWSASRVSGSFLTYREMEGKRGGTGLVTSLAASRAGKTPESTRGSDSDAEGPQEEGPDGYRYKPDGLMKQSFSITTSNGNHLHLISYYSRSSPNAQSLNNPTSDPTLRSIRPAKGMYPESTVHEHQNIPAVTRTPMASAGFSQTPHMAGSQAPSQHPQQQAVQAQNRTPSDPPMSKIDPRLMVPSPLAPQTNHQSSYSRSPSPMPPRQESSNSTPTQVNGHANGASSIPSIGSIMNEPNHTNGETQVERINRSPSRSPGGTKRSKGPKDIPGHKMGFVEDKRALNALDKAFKT
ncbi:MAG: hypothetical protein Q9215_005447 [Flavoplaca cf. flavocitrina]